MSDKQLVQILDGRWVDPCDVVLVDLSTLGTTKLHVFVMLRQTESDGTPHGRPMKLWSPEFDTEAAAIEARDRLAEQINAARLWDGTINGRFEPA